MSNRYSYSDVFPIKTGCCVKIARSDYRYKQIIWTGWPDSVETDYRAYRLKGRSGGYVIAQVCAKC